MPYLLHSKPERAGRYQIMFGKTHPFLPIRNGLVPRTAHTMPHLATAAALLSLLARYPLSNCYWWIFDYPYAKHKRTGASSLPSTNAWQITTLAVTTITSHFCQVSICLRATLFPTLQIVRALQDFVLNLR